MCWKLSGCFPDQFKIRALTAKKNVDLLASQILTFKPEMAAVYDAALAQSLTDRLPNNIATAIFYGDGGYHRAATLKSIDTVVTAMVGAAGLLPTMAAIDAGKKHCPGQQGNPCHGRRNCHARGLLKKKFPFCPLTASTVPFSNV